MELKDVVVGMRIALLENGVVHVVTGIDSLACVCKREPEGPSFAYPPGCLTPHLTLPLEAGKRYVRRNGSVTKPLRPTNVSTSYPWYDGVHSLTKEGGMWAGGGRDKNDLIADYVPVEAQPGPTNADVPVDANITITEAWHMPPPAPTHLLPEDPAERKKFPVFDGFLNYFPAACLLASRVSYEGNEQHNPGQPLHWARGKSTDQRSAAVRHLMEAAAESDAPRRAYLLAQALWRVAAECQLACEAAGGLAAMYPGKEGGK